MRYFTLAVLLVIAASIGVIVGVLLVRPSDTTLAVTAQQREDQITIFWEYSGVCQNETPEWRTVGVGVGLTCTPQSGYDGRGRSIELGAGDYPDGTVYRLEVTNREPWPTTTCWRLYDLTVDIPVDGGEICGNGLPSEPRLRSGPFSLVDASHEYVVQGRKSDPNCAPSPWGIECENVSLFAARIIAEWEEELVMNGGPPAVGGIVELRDDPNAQRDQPASDSSLPLPASVAVGLLVMGAGGLYVVRMRRD